MTCALTTGEPRRGAANGGTGDGRRHPRGTGFEGRGDPPDGFPACGLGPWAPPAWLAPQESEKSSARGVSCGSKANAEPIAPTKGGQDSNLQGWEENQVISRRYEGRIGLGDKLATKRPLVMRARFTWSERDRTDVRSPPNGLAPR